MVNANDKYDLIKIQDINNNDVYINKKYVTRIHQNSANVIEIQLLNETTIFTNETNIDLLAEKISI
jgi:hypothetical protein|tara:strand:- start:504 stop:701 length:198 start_codon:yes stop_codon:yes gene_type:complete